MNGSHIHYSDDHKENTQRHNLNLLHVNMFQKVWTLWKSFFTEWPQHLERYCEDIDELQQLDECKGGRVLHVSTHWCCSRFKLVHFSNHNGLVENCEFDQHHIIVLVLHICFQVSWAISVDFITVFGHNRQLDFPSSFPSASQLLNVEWFKFHICECLSKWNTCSTLVKTFRINHFCTLN